ncbi:flagellar basal body P-ring formation chaperone FlgA [Agaribacterium sp. ZY112]|uniref:flagellar basal body P-ring formation chaperone FlgA n=1 Tax=Agaribacterium sp. ZY112 TaxID=3233574 RepID=UPI00352681AD
MRLRIFLLLMLSSISVDTLAIEVSELSAMVHERVKEALSDRFTEEELENDVTIKLSNLHSQLRIKNCERGLSIQLQKNRVSHRNLSAKVQCLSGSRWSMYVPVKIDYYVEAAITSRALSRSEHLSLSDIRFERRLISEVGQHYIDQANLLKNVELKRSVGTGHILTPMDIRDAKLVYKGEIVRLLAKSGALTVSSEGIALADAAMGQQLRVRNLSSNRVVDARISAPGEALVSNW